MEWGSFSGATEPFLTFSFETLVSFLFFFGFLIVICERKYRRLSCIDFD